MKRITLKLTGVMLCAALVLAALISFDGSEVYASSDDEDLYKLVWSDEFVGTELNTDTWNYELGNGTYGWGNNEYQYYTDEEDNVSVSNGTLKITAITETTDDGSTMYTSGRINTSGNQSFKYGRLEARIKVPSVTGLWPAFWMLGYNDSGWPYCGEIDILETWNTYDFAQGTLHHVDEVNKANQDTYKSAQMSNVGKTGWHVYGIIWTSSTMQFYVDDEVYLTIDISDSTYSEIRAPFYFLLNMAVGGTLPGYTIDEFTEETMYVDYVRVYQRESDGGSNTSTWSEADQAAVPTYTVKFKNNGKVIQTDTVYEGETVSFPTVKKKGYTFKGWYCNGKKVTEDTRITGNMIIRAKWTKVKVKKTSITAKAKYGRYISVSLKTAKKVNGFQVKIGKKTYVLSLKSMKKKKNIVEGKFAKGKTYTVKARAYILDSRNKKVYGKWSKKKKVKL